MPLLDGIQETIKRNKSSIIAGTTAALESMQCIDNE